MQVVILCGGKGRRMGNDDLPKALFPIGDKPILWHLMSIYAYYGFCDFILCLGYRGESIKKYFSKMEPTRAKARGSVGGILSGQKLIRTMNSAVFGRECIKNWKIRFLDTGLEVNTGGRLKKVKAYIKEDCFFATYGDGLSDINLNKLIQFHKIHKRAATLTAVKPYSQFGIVGIDSSSNTVTHFEEKPILDHWINGGFFIFSKDIFKYIHEDDVLEKDTFSRLVKDKNLTAYKHPGFWKCMDTYKDNLDLNQLWLTKNAPWALWKG